ncbi:hypothetical protein [Mangrovihabitans endophyticus]|uniref:Uncharacterized protein n=1 Tax=Mangrovihabitans endophyticus TaxID=1751298 RepID=A0A8J3BUQ4_9ACTN|nr:hypothetical protein [Mangrovihabitans endophyticus]GGK70757.1 hypothetical protein GCM10012284_00780 [Mangrovihabitans endophyticus]
MVKERARRRAERLAVLEREKAARARVVQRRERRRALIRRLRPAPFRSAPFRSAPFRPAPFRPARLRPRRRGAGRLTRFTRAQRTGIVVVPLLAAGAVWYLVPELALRILLTIMIILVLPALVVVALGRRL